MIKMKKKGNLKDPSPPSPPLKKITGQKFRSNLLKRFEGSIRSIIFSRRIGPCTLTRDYRSKFSLFFQAARFEARHARRWREISARAFSRASEVPAVAGTRMWPPPRHTWAGREFRNSRQSESTGTGLAHSTYVQVTTAARSSTFTALPSREESATTIPLSLSIISRNFEERFVRISSFGELRETWREEL